MRLLSDLGSCVNYIRLLGRRRSSAEAQPAALPLRARALRGERVYCRAATSDLAVFYETFNGRYHVPPAGLRIRTILDLGSNIGLTMAHYASLYPEARILGVEIDRRNADMCRANIAPYVSRCEVLVGAAWKENGEIAYAGDAEWGFRIVPESCGGRHRVRAFSMPALIDRLGVQRVDFVKMDIEGAELDVLAGAREWADRVNCLKVEVHPPYTLAACVEDLENAGMECEVMPDHFGCVVARRSGTPSGQNPRRILP
jgi:FkbM family methyltransferase